MEEYLSSLSDQELIKFNQAKALVEFCQRLWYSLDDIEDVSADTRNVVAHLIWQNLFQIISPFQQTMLSYNMFHAAERDKKWEYVSEYDFEVTKEYLEFEGTKWENYSKDKEASVTEGKKLFNKIIREEYFK